MDGRNLFIILCAALGNLSAQQGYVYPTPEKPFNAGLSSTFGQIGSFSSGFTPSSAPNGVFSTDRPGTQQSSNGHSSQQASSIPSAHYPRPEQTRSESPTSYSGTIVTSGSPEGSDGVFRQETPLNGHSSQGGNGGTPSESYKIQNGHSTNGKISASFPQQATIGSLSSQSSAPQKSSSDITSDQKGYRYTPPKTQFTAVTSKPSETISSIFGNSQFKSPLPGYSQTLKPSNNLSGQQSLFNGQTGNGYQTPGGQTPTSSFSPQGSTGKLNGHTEPSIQSQRLIPDYFGDQKSSNVYSEPQRGNGQLTDYPRSSSPSTSFVGQPESNTYFESEGNTRQLTGYSAAEKLTKKPFEQIAQKQTPSAGYPNQQSEIGSQRPGTSSLTEPQPQSGLTSPGNTVESFATSRKPSINQQFTSGQHDLTSFSPSSSQAFSGKGLTNSYIPPHQQTSPPGYTKAGIQQFSSNNGLTSSPGRPFERAQIEYQVPGVGDSANGRSPNIQGSKTNSFLGFSDSVSGKPDSQYSLSEDQNRSRPSNGFSTYGKPTEAQKSQNGYHTPERPSTNGYQDAGTPQFTQRIPAYPSNDKNPNPKYSSASTEETKPLGNSGNQDSSASSSFSRQPPDTSGRLSSSETHEGFPGENDVDQGDYSAIPGEPDTDYPILRYVPDTSFKCDQQQFDGYYADVETRCQVFHVCAKQKTYDFLCPNGTIFHQEYLVCVWWNKFDCNSAPSLYGVNEHIYDFSISGVEQTGGIPIGEPYRQTGTDGRFQTPNIQIGQGTPDIGSQISGRYPSHASGSNRYPSTEFQGPLGSETSKETLGGNGVSLSGYPRERPQGSSFPVSSGARPHGINGFSKDISISTTGYPNSPETDIQKTNEYSHIKPQNADGFTSEQNVRAPGYPRGPEVQSQDPNKYPTKRPHSSNTFPSIKPDETGALAPGRPIDYPNGPGIARPVDNHSGSPQGIGNPTGPGAGYPSAEKSNGLIFPPLDTELPGQQKPRDRPEGLNNLSSNGYTNSRPQAPSIPIERPDGTQSSGSQITNQGSQISQGFATSVPDNVNPSRTQSAFPGSPQPHIPTREYLPSLNQ